MQGAPLKHPATIALVMVNFATSRGVSPQDCLLGTGVTLEDLARPDTWLKRCHEIRLIENLISNLPHMPALGFELGMQYNISTFGTWGFAIRTSPTLNAAVHTALRYLPLSTAYCKFSIVRTEHVFGLAADPSEIPPNLHDFLLQRDLGTAFNLLRELGLKGLPLQRLEFTSLSNPDRQRIEELTGIETLTGRASNAILMDACHTEAQLPTFDRHLLRVMEDQCDRQLAQQKLDGLTGKVRQILRCPSGLQCTLEDVADLLSIPARTLRRRLSEEGVSFRDLVEIERKQLVLQLLATGIKLDEIAMHLGYTDTASFTRAFRRWYQCSPGEYRRLNFV